MIVSITNQKGGVGKTSSAANLGVLLAREGRRVLLVDADPQFALTRQLGIEERSLGVNLVDVLAGRAGAEDAIVAGVHGVDVIASGRDLAGIELSLVGELGRERFLRDALEPVIRRLRRRRDRHAAEPRAADRQRARARRDGARAGQRRGRRLAARHPRAAAHRAAARSAARPTSARDRRDPDALGAVADQQPHDVARAGPGGLGAGGENPRSLGAVHSSGR